ncbi:MAG TPA: hypothetical protein VGQ57_15145 [Polyangiaceae bacterium]|jgi:SAM-dependent methyltransferase|nr:hypothetical protein [Polyangiaceae bacterium]
MRQLLIDRDPSAGERLRASLEALPNRERDAWLDSVLGIDAFPPDGADLPRSCTPYLPCSVDVLLRTVERARITSEDVFVDIGSGVGRVAVLVHVLTGAAAVGLEVQRALVEQSRALAETLSVTRVATIEGDAAEMVKLVPLGTVFFLYCPFSGARLERVLHHLEAMARARTIRICCVQLPALEREWLKLVSADEELSIYRSLPA